VTIAVNHLRVLSWNVRGTTGIDNARLRGIVDAMASSPAEIVLLQEVSAAGDLVTRMRSAFAEKLSLKGWCFSGGSRDKLYGNVIASRFPVSIVRRRPKPDAPWPHLLARGMVQSPTRAIEAISAHIPNGAKYGWKKIDTLEALGTILVDEYKTPRVLGGDFNEPEGVGPDNAIISAQVASDGSVFGRWRDRYGRQDQCWRWQSAVDHVLGPRSILAHAWLARNRGVPAVTHVTRGKKCFFDHLLASRDHFNVVDAGFHHAWREQGLSDHSAAWSIIRWRS